MKYVIVAVISFLLGLFTRNIIHKIKNKKKRKKKKYKTKFKKVKPLNQQDFKKAMEDLEIK